MNAADNLYPSDCEISPPEKRGLIARHISYSIGQKRLLDDISLIAETGKLTILIGPNGAGKSTTLSLLAGDLMPAQGEVKFDGKSLSDWPADTLALRRAVLPQSPELGFAFRTRDVVALGRHPHRNHTHATQQKAISWAMAAAGVTRFADQECHSLSGGERHRVHFARVLAQLWTPEHDGKMRALLLDEPTAGLDLYHQHRILSMARTMAGSGAAVVAVLHDLDLAMSYGDHVVVLNHGRLAAAGAPKTVLSKTLIEDIWRMPCDILQDSTGRRHVAVRPSNRQQPRWAAE